MKRSIMTKGLGAIALAAVALAATTGPLTAPTAPEQLALNSQMPSEQDIAKSRAAAMSVSPGHLWRAGR